MRCSVFVYESEMSYFNYKMLISQLQKAKLDFGIREYIPKLMTKVTPIPAAGWQKAVFTEGHFKKETRQQILNYWKNKSIGIEKKKEEEEDKPKPNPKPKPKPIPPDKEEEPPVDCCVCPPPGYKLVQEDTTYASFSSSTEDMDSLLSSSNY